MTRAEEFLQSRKHSTALDGKCRVSTPHFSGGFDSNDRFYLSTANDGLVYFPASEGAALARALSRIFIEER